MLLKCHPCLRTGVTYVSGLYNLLGVGSHVANFFRDGVKIATVGFAVVTPTVQFNGGSTLALSYGSERLDTPCASPNNGIVSIFNYNVLGAGPHVAEFFRDDPVIR